jgi:hypothetical protein
VGVFASHCLKGRYYNSFSLNRASTLAKVLMANATMVSPASRIRLATSLLCFVKYF